MREALDVSDELFRVVSRRQHDDVARSLILRDEQTLPERARLRVLEVFRPVGQASNAGHRLDGRDPLGQLSQLIEVAVGRDVRRRHAQNELAAGRKPTVDLGRFLKLRIVRRKEELLIPREDLSRIWVLRKVLNPLSPVEAMELLIDKLSKTRSNSEFLANMSSL